MFGVIRLVNSTSFFPSLLYKISAFMMGISLYLLLSTLAIELINLILKIEPTNRGIIILSITFLIVFIGFANSYRIRSTKYVVPIEGLNKNIRIAHLSDIHLGHFRKKKFLDKSISIALKNNPDMVMITGDLFDGIIRINNESIESLKNIDVPVYFIGGNHDVYSGLDRIKQIVRNQGVRVLENELVLEGELQIIGLDHMLADSKQRDIHAVGKYNMKDVLPTLGIDKNKPSLLLHHSPDGIEYANKEGIDLYLSGHTHGGQLFPVSLINELIFKYNKGIAKFKETTIIVSRGIGTFGPPIRIGSKSEVVIIDLIASTSD